MKFTVNVSRCDEIKQRDPETQIERIVAYDIGFDIENLDTGETYYTPTTVYLYQLATPDKASAIEHAIRTSFAATVGRMYGKYAVRALDYFDTLEQSLNK